jgi:hypothetical protein
MTKPHKCPVCEGAGEVPDAQVGIGTAVTTFAACPACNGKCVVWEPELAIPKIEIISPIVPYTRPYTPEGFPQPTVTWGDDSSGKLVGTHVIDGYTHRVEYNAVTHETDYLDNELNVIPRTIIKTEEHDVGATISVMSNPDHPAPYVAENKDTLVEVIRHDKCGYGCACSPGDQPHSEDCKGYHGES